MAPSSIKFDKLEGVNLGDGKIMEFHHFTNNFPSYAECYSPNFAPSEEHLRLIIPTHYHRHHDEHIYVLEGRMKVTHQVYADSIPATSTLLPKSLCSRIISYLFPAKRPMVWVETILDATTPDGTRHVDLKRNLKHGMEQLPGSALRVRESNSPEGYFIVKEQFFREFFQKPIPPTLLVFSTMGDRGDHYAEFDFITYSLSWIGQLFYPQRYVSDEEMRYHYENTVERETPTPYTHPLLLGKDSIENSADPRRAATVQKDQKKSV